MTDEQIAKLAQTYDYDVESYVEGYKNGLTVNMTARFEHYESAIYENDVTPIIVYWKGKTYHLRQFNKNLPIDPQRQWVLCGDGEEPKYYPNKEAAFDAYQVGL